MGAWILLCDLSIGYLAKWSWEWNHQYHSPILSIEYMNRVSLPFNLAPSSIHIRVATISSHSPGRRHRWQSGRKMYLRTFESSSSTSLSSLCGCYRYQLYKRGALTPSCQTLPSWRIIIILLLQVLFCWEFFFVFFLSSAAGLHISGRQWSKHPSHHIRAKEVALVHWRHKSGVDWPSVPF